MNRGFLAAVLLLGIFADAQDSDFCAAYTECVAVSRLEERLCLGNSRLRPYWLPESTDPNNCHEKLNPDYDQLQQLEISVENLFLSCLRNGNPPESQECSSDTISDSPHFSAGRTISYVPTLCFTGVDRRIERQCAKLRKCCPAVGSCENLLSSGAAFESLKEAAVQMRMRAHECQKGLPITPLTQNRIPSQSDRSGTLTVKITDEETQKAKESRNRDATGPTVTSEPIKFGEKSAGEVSRPTGSGSVTQVIFDRLDGHEEQMKKLLEKDGEGVLSIGSGIREEQPQLSFPKPGNGRITEVALSTENETEADFTHGKPEEESPKESDIVEETLSSLFRASVMSEGTGGMGLATNLARQSDKGKQATITVTSSPMILLQKTSSSPIDGPTNGTVKGCGMRRIHASKTLQMEKILNLLGEDSDSKDMNDIKFLINNWQKDVRNSLLDAKKRNKNKAIGEALDQLIAHFDQVNLGLLKANINATFTDEEYPDDDANIAGTICDPEETNDVGEDIGLEIEHIDGSGASGGEEANQMTVVEPSPLRENEKGEKVIVEDGVEKIVVNDENLHLDSSTEQTNSDAENSAESSDSSWKEDYKKELATYRKEHGGGPFTPTGRNETTCDSYMRCRNQMHLALDGCAWRFASVTVLLSLAESPESLLYRGEELCDPSDRPHYESLYEMMIKRNGVIRKCLDEKNGDLFDRAVCVPYSPEKSKLYDSALTRLLSADYEKSVLCFQDANLIQEKCSRLRECCPNFDNCRERSLDVDVEQAIISKTAQINERKQDCLRRKARDEFKTTLRELLGKGGWKTIELVKSGELGSSVSGFDRLRSRKVFRI